MQNLSLPGKISDIDFELGEGEVLGIAGLVSAGRTEILRSVAGLEPLSEGRMAIGGEDCAWPQSVREAIERGIALAPEDRKREGLVLSRVGALQPFAGRYRFSLAGAGHFACHATGKGDDAGQANRI